MSEIKYNLVDGEPVCNEECPFCETKTNWHTKSFCHITGQFVLEYGDYDDPCIPGWRQQRDALEEQIEGVQKHCEERKRNYNEGDYHERDLDVILEILNKKARKK